ncbi:hypothetical protein RJT34_19659 [Clitoria ternatea]|uniref:Uncharacterized protein n=1 Tax=Clitoria ternatea TaxID=43366 RepID=A0AAN9IRF4_CLITE
MVGRSSVARWELVEAERERVNPRVEREKPRMTRREGEWIGGGGQGRSEGRSCMEIGLFGVLGGRTGAGRPELDWRLGRPRPGGARCRGVDGGGAAAVAEEAFLLPSSSCFWFL